MDSVHERTLFHIHGCLRLPAGTHSGYHTGRLLGCEQAKIDVDALYDTKEGSKYWYKGGFSLAAIIALVCGAGASFPVLSLSWMIGLPISFVLYIILRKAGVDGVPKESS